MAWRIITMVCYRYTSLQNMPIHSTQAIWASNALLHINMDIISPWVAKMQGTTNPFPTPKGTRESTLRKEWVKPKAGAGGFIQEQVDREKFQQQKGTIQTKPRMETLGPRQTGASGPGCPFRSHANTRNQKQSAGLDKQIHRGCERGTLGNWKRYRGREAASKKEPEKLEGNIATLPFIPER